MTDYLLALFLGFIEGLTEFIPVSSTAHLLILSDLMAFSGPPGHVFEIFIQLGAILAVVFLYRRKLWKTATEWPHDPSARHFILILIAGTIPALIAGLIGRDFIKATLYNPYVIASALIIGGIIMLVVDRSKPNAKTCEDFGIIPLKGALFIGCFQAVALIPGVSRSGASIIGGLSAGLSRKAAAEFSFFLAIPVMFAAVTYDTYKSWQDISSGDYWPLMITGFLAAFITAMAVIRFALYIINRFGFYPFALYRIAAGILILCLFS
jgi:undecaprenyl-diphosphatase